MPPNKPGVIVFIPIRQSSLYNLIPQVAKNNIPWLQNTVSLSFTHPQASMLFYEIQWIYAKKYGQG